MFGFRLWAPFGMFRDPLTITQNLSFSIPPKTTVGGMMAAILGIDYNEYFNDNDYFSFRYSVIPFRPLRKKSFVQNYIDDYSGRSNTKIADIKKQDYGKINQQFAKSKKPIYREILINPEYLIFVHNFKHEKQIIDFMENHFSAYSLYMGNTEFSANYEYLACEAVEKELIELHSFTGEPYLIDFEENNKYSSIYFATQTIADRKYTQYKNVVFCDSLINKTNMDNRLKLKEPIRGFEVKTKLGGFNCDFI